MKMDAKTIFRKFGSLLILLILMVCMGILSNKFFTLSNLKNIGIQSSVNIILSFGMLMVIIIGGIDLSIGAILALSGIVAAYMMKAGVPIPVALIVSCIVGAALGAINGFCSNFYETSTFRSNFGNYRCIQRTALLITEGLPVSQLPEGIRGIGQGTLLKIPNPIVIMVIVAIVVHVLLTYTSYGRSLYGTWEAIMRQQDFPVWQ